MFTIRFCFYLILRKNEGWEGAGIATLSMYSSSKIVLRGMWVWWQHCKEMHKNGSAWHVLTSALHHWEGTTWLSRKLPTKSGSYPTVQILSKIRRKKERKVCSFAIAIAIPHSLDFTWIAAFAYLAL